MKNTHRASSTLASVQTEASPVNILSLCVFFDFLLSFYSPAVQPDDNQSQRSKTSLCLIHKQPIVMQSGPALHLIFTYITPQESTPPRHGFHVTALK